MLHFANANGYPPAAYTPLFAGLTPHYHVVALRSLPLTPGADPASLRHWDQLADELSAYLEQAGARGWVGVGHSLGAVVSVLVALRRPEFFRCLVAIEPVFFSPLKIMSFDVMRALGLAERMHPLVPGARRRRRNFASADEMFARYRNAPVFRRLDDRALRAYVEALAVPRPDGQPGVTLSFTPDWEAQVYATGPYNLWGKIGKLKVPLLVIRGDESDTFDLGAVEALHARLPAARLVHMPHTGHLVPLEQPQAVANLIVEFAGHDNH